jgi:VanZ family protein
MRLSDRLTPQWRHRLFVAYVVAMVLVLLTPTPDTGVEFSHIDKVAHFLLFFGFALVYFFDRKANPGRMFLMSALFAAAVELVQWVLPFRDVQLADFVAGAAGAGAGAVLVLLIRRQVGRVAARSAQSGEDSARAERRQEREHRRK